MTTHEDIVDAVCRKLGLLTGLSPEDESALAKLTFSIEAVPRLHHLVREGRELARCCIIAEGYACRYKTTAEGRRQIVSFHMRGDIVDLQHLLFDRADCSVQTITPAVVACVPSRALLHLAHERPTIGDALWRDTLVDASIFREWVLNVGQRHARSRVAHLLCEFAARGQAVGLGSRDGFDLPMTQEQIGDAAGLTSVHVNRTLRTLREDGIISQAGKRIVVRDWQRLSEVAGFEPGYLRVTNAEAA